MQLVIDLGALTMAVTAMVAAIYGGARGVVRALDHAVGRHTGPLSDRLDQVERQLARIERKQP